MGFYRFGLFLAAHKYWTVAEGTADTIFLLSILERRPHVFTLGSSLGLLSKKGTDGNFRYRFLWHYLKPTLKITAYICSPPPVRDRGSTRNGFHVEAKFASRLARKRHEMLTLRAMEIIASTVMSKSLRTTRSAISRHFFILQRIPATVSCASMIIEFPDYTKYALMSCSTAIYICGGEIFRNYTSCGL